MITAVRNKTFQNLQLNAGAVFANLDVSDVTTTDGLRTAIADALKDKTKVLGATRGGGTFSATPEVRNIEADGKRYEFVGSTIFDTWTVQLSTTLIEITPENMQRVMAACNAPVVSGGVTKVRVRTDLKPEDYIPKITWVGDTSDGGLMLIELENAVNTSGATLTINDKGEGTLPVEFHAHQADAESTEFAPFTVRYFKDIPA